MVKFDKFTLDNGLIVIVNNDPSTTIAAVNLLYNVGSRFESTEKTGFAHLFEHLMFGGSINIPIYDKPLQTVGGENNAFTNNDITNYYITLPVENIETAFWLESDRMLSLAFSEKSLEVQKNVVIEEYKQRYLNQPYGDVWFLLRDMVYKEHPYRWATIGKDMAHVENATIEDVKSFFNKFYAPNNCILTVSGNIDLQRVRELAEKWFGPIERRNVVIPELPVEPKQLKPRVIEVERDVPQSAIYKAWHMCSRLHLDYHATDVISDILANGNSSRLYQSLVKDKKMFSDINAYISGDIDAGMFIITGNPLPEVNIYDADKAISKEIELLINESLSVYELDKVKNKFESTRRFSDISALNKAMSLSYYELLGDANMLNDEVQKYRGVDGDQIHRVAKELFDPNNCSTLFYHSKV